MYPLIYVSVKIRFLGSDPNLDEINNEWTLNSFVSPSGVILGDRIMREIQG